LGSIGVKGRGKGREGKGGREGRKEGSRGRSRELRGREIASWAGLGGEREEEHIFLSLSSKGFRSEKGRTSRRKDWIGSFEKGKKGKQKSPERLRPSEVLIRSLCLD